MRGGDVHDSGDAFVDAGEFLFQVSVTSPQTAQGNFRYFVQWQDATTSTIDSVTAPASTPTSIYTYTASFAGDVTSEVSATSSGLVYTRGTHQYTGNSVKITNTSPATISGPIQAVLDNLIFGRDARECDGHGAGRITLRGFAAHHDRRFLACAGSVRERSGRKFTYTGSAPISYTTKTLFRARSDLETGKKMIKLIRNFSLVFALAGAAHAGEIVTYAIDVNTSGLSTDSGYLDFQFNPGPSSDPATVTLSGFTSDGTLVPGAPDGGNIGDVISGTLPGTVIIGNADVLNDYNEGFDGSGASSMYP